MQPKTLVDTLAATLSEMDVKTIGDTLGCVETRSLVKRLAFKLEVLAEALDQPALLASRC